MNLSLHAKIPLYFSLIFIWLGCWGCSPVASAGFIQPTHTVTNTAVKTVLPSLTATVSPLLQKVIYLAPYLPEGFINKLNIPADIQKTTETANSNLQIDFGQDNVISKWVYALVAPFPTIYDGIQLNMLKQLWDQGNLPGYPDQKILVDQGTYAVFKQVWGNPSPSVTTVTTADMVTSAWEIRTAWVILPFEQLEPRWKVLQVNGISPLDRNFSPDNYAITVNISLKGDLSFENEVLSKSNPGTAQGLAPASNRDSNKMTTINMTGVTAMVRDTAGLMERKGILYPDAQIKDMLRDADFVHISNEIAYTPRCPSPVYPVSKELVFCSKPDYNQLLVDVGANIIELSGDHFQDWGPEATIYTIDLYKKLGWMYYGGGYNLDDARKPLLIEHNGNKIAFIGCNAKPRGYAGASTTSPGAVHCDFDYLVDQIKQLRSNGYIPIVTFQHVEYYSYKAEEPLITDFRRVAAAGAEIVSGSQGHQPQALEFVGSEILHYGLGNLFFDQYYEGLPTRQAFIDKHVFYAGKHISTVLQTIQFIDNAQSRPMTSDERQGLLETIFKASGW